MGVFSDYLTCQANTDLPMTFKHSNEMEVTDIKHMEMISGAGK